jgi:hypothetical protein
MLSRLYAQCSPLLACTLRRGTLCAGNVAHYWWQQAGNVLNDSIMLCCCLH